MADIKISPLPGIEQETGAGPSQVDITEAIELLFFAYRDFISDPDAILADFDFGRAHHRVIHFVGRHPGINVAELLKILRITKQSLARVLKELIDRGFIEQQTGTRDRRQRLLYLTGDGLKLENRLTAPQRARVEEALRAAGPSATQVWRDVLRNLIDSEERISVDRLLAEGRKEAEEQ